MDEPISRRLTQLAKIYLGAFSNHVEELDINRYHFILLLIAEHEGQLTQKKLGQITGKDKSAMVNIINSLTDKGYVYRELNPDDRRGQLIKITEKAQQDIPAIRQSFQLLNHKATEGINSQKLDIFNEVLQQMSVNLIPLASKRVSFQLKKSNH
ncbi:MarR family winged helix-turn-helix transcriptional regulator [Mucilaginibacter paludis]|uniref:Regulatory protein MarR n=1 Tax=Mucilaginibacter paludis DSM 18603 TaxID=714943 RepID=H1Y8S6_9SPHI|nr:MarR family transcriptional regulator [Mucilaginibacter paludis]EHQ26948.1 regulatory protein MarR [Mucilaginibacter paludis DSM 18603]